jgi:hypothetical protein
VQSLLLEGNNLRFHQGNRSSISWVLDKEDKKTEEVDEAVGDRKEHV